MNRAAIMELLGKQRVVIALVLLIVFGALRYDNFLGLFNILTVLRYNSMFALTGLGMCFVIMTGGIDLSVGAVAALASVVSALLSPIGPLTATLGGLACGVIVGAINGFMITRMRILPFIATLAAMLAARGMALLLAQNDTVSVSYDSGFTDIGQGDVFGFPLPAWIGAIAFVYGSIMLNRTSFGRHILAVGGNEDAARLMGLPVDRTTFLVYVQSGFFASLAGVILSAQFGAGQPAEGVGWELFSIAGVVVGGTLLTGGLGSVFATLIGILLLGLVFNILNFENGMGWISLSAYWQSVVRGVFLMVVVMVGPAGGKRLLRVVRARAEQSTTAAGQTGGAG
jgi:ribose transport system permease protein